MRENRDALRTSLFFVAGALCGAGIMSLVDENRRNRLRSTIPGILNLPGTSDQYASDADVTTLVREQLREVCAVDNISIEVRDRHVTVWNGINIDDATRIADCLSKMPLIASFYVQPDDTRYMREFQDEHGVAVREHARDAQLLAA